MQKITKKKKITIETSGPLRIKGGIRGPIEIPYLEDIAIIGKMIMSGYKVTEHLSDGTTVKLDVHNYNKENGKGDLRMKVENIRTAKEIIQANKAHSAKVNLNKPSAGFTPIIDVYTKK